MDDPHHDQGNEVRLSRRAAMAGVGLLPIGLVAGAAWAQQGVARPAPDAQNIGHIFDDLPLCKMTPQTVEGPYFVPTQLVRSDVREAQKGEALRVRLQAVDANNKCRPAENAVFSIWSCNAFGMYSGFPHVDPDTLSNFFYDPKPTRPANRGVPRNSELWLRGVQAADANGAAAFTTVFPGWYAPRTPHIHVRVLIGAQELATTQFLFPQALANEILSTKQPYAKRGLSIYTNESDRVRLQANANDMNMFSISRDPDGVMVAAGRIGLSHV